MISFIFFFFQAEDGIRDRDVTGVQTCALPISLWGPGGYSGDVVIAIGFSEEQLREIFDEVNPAMRVTSQYAIPEEANLTIYLCRKPRKKLPDIWAKLTWLG